MTNIEKKSLNHVLSILEGIDTYPSYRSLSSSLSENNISNEVSRNILDKHQESIAELSKKVTESKQWITAILKDGE